MASPILPFDVAPTPAISLWALASVGSKATLEIDIEILLSVSGCQLEPPLRVVQMPPLVAPTNMVEEFTGDMAIDWMAPATVPLGG